jgi:hypothetical protein
LGKEVVGGDDPRQGSPSSEGKGCNESREESRRSRSQGSLRGTRKQERATVHGQTQPMGISDIEHGRVKIHAQPRGKAIADEHKDMRPYRKNVLQ